MHSLKNEDPKNHYTLSMYLIHVKLYIVEVDPYKNKSLADYLSRLLDDQRTH